MKWGARRRGAVNLFWPRFKLRRGDPRARRQAGWRHAAGAGKDLVLSHKDCLDGVAAAAITMRTHPGTSVAFAQPGDMVDALGAIAKVPGDGRRLWIADLSLQPGEFDAIVAACRRLVDAGWRVEWRDHHHKQWEGLDLGRLDMLDALVVNDDATQCGASLQFQAVGGGAFESRLAELARDRDLWWNKEPESELLEFALTDLGEATFLAHLVSASDPVDEVMQAAATRERKRQAKATARILGTTRSFGPPDARVALVYGWLPKNTGLHQLLEAGHHVAINIRPNGRASLRSRKGADVCHLVAREFHGGGHPNASGARLDLRGWAKWQYVMRKGRVAAAERLAARAVAILEEHA